MSYLCNLHEPVHDPKEIVRQGVEEIVGDEAGVGRFASYVLQPLADLCAQATFPAPAYSYVLSHIAPKFWMSSGLKKRRRSRSLLSV